MIFRGCINVASTFTVSNTFTFAFSKLFTFSPFYVNLQKLIFNLNGKDEITVQGSHIRDSGASVNVTDSNGYASPTSGECNLVNREHLSHL